MKLPFYKVTFEPEECQGSGAGPQTGQKKDVSVSEPPLSSPAGLGDPQVQFAGRQGLDSLEMTEDPNTLKQVVAQCGPSVVMPLLTYMGNYQTLN